MFFDSPCIYILIILLHTYLIKFIIDLDQYIFSDVLVRFQQLQTTVIALLE